MNELTNYQIIQQSGKPAFVVIPYDEFMANFQTKEATIVENGLIPHEIVERNALNGVPLIKAWREYLGMTQQELANKSDMKQSSLARLETKPISPRKNTLMKLAKAMNLSVEQLEED